MLTDILTTPQNIDIEGKIYSFEFNHASLAVLEKETNKSVYEIYDILIKNNSLTLDDSLAMLYAGMLKHHSKEDILKTRNDVENYPGLFSQFKEALLTAFLMPMMPPEILLEFANDKKKVSTNLI